MIGAFEPAKTVFYALLLAFVILFFGGNIAALLPALLLILASHGFESFHRADVNRVYGKAPPDRTAVFRVSLFLAVLAAAFSFYFGFSYWYVLIVALAFAGSYLSSRYQFASDFLLSLIYPALMVLHSADRTLLAPVYWFVFFQELASRSVVQLSRPFGMENLNLPQILGPEGAANFVLVLECLSALWPVLMARYVLGLPFFAFSLSAMVLAAAVYALAVSHIERSGLLLRVSSLIFLLSLWLSLMGSGF